MKQPRQLARGNLHRRGGRSAAAGREAAAVDAFVCAPRPVAGDGRQTKQRQPAGLLLVRGGSAAAAVIAATRSPEGFPS